MWETLIVTALVVAAVAVVIQRARRALQPAPELADSGCAGCAARTGCCAGALSGQQRGLSKGTEESRG